MLYKHSQSRHHKIEKAHYEVTNWPEYNKALRQHGDITGWVHQACPASALPSRLSLRGSGLHDYQRRRPLLNLLYFITNHYLHVLCMVLNMAMYRLIERWVI